MSNNRPLPQRAYTGRNFGEGKMNTLTRISCALALAACMSGAHATDHYVAATLTNLQIQVIDLAPGDGRPPGYAVSVPGSYTLLESGLLIDPAQPVIARRFESMNFVPHSSLAADGAALARASRSGPIGELATESRSDNRFVDASFALGNAADSLEVLVAPATRLVFTGQYKLERALSDDGETPLSSSSQVYVRLDDRWGTVDAFYDRLTQPIEPLASLVQVREGSFQLSFDAFDAETIGLLFSVATSIAAPVPEPANWLLVLAGLAAMGLQAKAKSWGQRRKASFSV